MTLRVDQVFLAAAMAIAAASLVSSCALLPRAPGEHPQESEPIERASLRQIVQLDFGRQAVFAACIEPACPTITPKTLANAQPIATAPAPAVANSNVQKAATVSRAEMNAAIEPANVDASPPRKQPSPLVLYFPLGGAALTASDKAALDELIPSASKAQRIAIAGRTDNAAAIPRIKPSRWHVPIPYVTTCARSCLRVATPWWSMRRGRAVSSHPTTRRKAENRTGASRSSLAFPSRWRHDVRTHLLPPSNQLACTQLFWRNS